MHNSIEQTNGQACIQRLRELPTETTPPYNWQEFQRRSLRRSAAANDVVDWRPIAAAAAFLLFVCAIAIWGRLGGGGRHVVADSGAVADGAATWKHDALPLANYTDGAYTDEGWRPRGKGSGSSAGGVSGEKMAPRAVGPSGTATLGAESRAMGPSVDRVPRALGSSVDGTPQAREPGETATPYGGPRVTGSGDSAIAASRSRAIESWLATLPREPTVVRVGTRAAVAGLEDRIAQVDDLVTSMRIDGMQPDGVADLQRERLRLVGSLAQVRYAEVVSSQSP